MNEKKFIATITKNNLVEQRYRGLAQLIQEAIEATTGVHVYVNLFDDEQSVVLRVEEVPMVSFEYTDF